MLDINRDVINRKNKRLQNCVQFVKTFPSSETSYELEHNRFILRCTRNMKVTFLMVLIQTRAI